MEISYTTLKKKTQKLLFCEINIVYCIGLELCKMLKIAYCLPLERGSGKPIAQPGRGTMAPLLWSKILYS